MQDEISLAVLEGLKIKLLGEEREKIIKRGTENTEAYHLYLRGLYHAEIGIEGSAHKALDYFQKASDKDPNYALAHAGEAIAYAQLTPYVLSPEEGSLKAKAAVKKAMDIDESSSETHATMGMISFWLDWDWSAADKEFKCAVELDANDARAHHMYSVFLGATGRNEEAQTQIRRALELDPLSLEINNDIAWNYYFARDYDRAIEFYKKTLELDPNYAMALRELGEIYMINGMFEEAISALEKATQISSGDRTRAKLARVYAEANAKDKALKILHELLERSEQRHVSPTLIAEIYTGLGENDKAFEWLEKAYRQRDNILATIKVTPRWDSLRLDPRFKELLKKMNL